MLELYQGSERAAAIVGAALLEVRLTERITRSFPVDGETKKQLFASTGPLGAWDVKTKLAYTLGVISKEAFQECGIIGQIRNKFAHKLKVKTFEHADIRRLCFNLKILESHDFHMGVTEIEGTPVSLWRRNTDFDSRLTDPRSRYLTTIQVFLSALAFPRYETKSPPLPPLI